MHLTTGRLGDSQAFLIDGLGDSQRNPTRQRGRWTIQQLDCWSPGNFPPCLACLRGYYPGLRGGLRWGIASGPWSQRSLALFSLAAFCSSQAVEPPKRPTAGWR
ncbi:hypothetical protein [Aureliella helgolandensis]|uniref:hypothetical protein n=1 Tax=Aureliella helgolandensis TaxID=2527968 RepID=UPI00119D6A1F|nr:hypothetical protein [Aureliella helgolandensis]